ncbi:tRNA (adenosine(37)-N6)-threonylcarbamoyltransferase complex dimerization subunit type 1 TsaB [Gleimia sp. 6138-11-ORH1]|uniref:tRNA (adenosine(37)-N6)-threonylcarbamoyltransferase complex dimerization subunit type 1 TsaB n=1 Tax=Gleimia sp. 6138-11-ORH1 TaxID=2973937 RepID=UPI0021699F9F|nr:tRNA (adenosine(37)-N6)-threonylcarbamoyltransferase complex dimerization subunit type 1 TsaB [Gleimia sp. 6138-11-ORH1]MCS4484575.1 tRNA (adenosine(37)-N6)-threonylcarbamoyltransferase complex dimerization subunit type 1 TsaB [Gleimia sp. 6138-11-ORH1]
MTTLCIDTSFGASVAVVSTGGEILSVVEENSSRVHTERLSVLISEALLKAGLPTPVKKAGLTQIIVGTGPAPFTGLRAGLVTARVLGKVCDVPVRGVCSLDVIARQYLDNFAADQELVVVTDARRKEVYSAHYLANGPDDVTCLNGPQVAQASEIANQYRGKPVKFVGAGTEIYSDVFASAVPVKPLQIAVAYRLVKTRLAAGETDFNTEPLYLRRPDVHTGKV